MRQLFILFSLLLGAAWAQGSASWQGEQGGVAVRVTVIARGHTIPERVRQTRPWWRWGNTESDAYLFSFSGDRGVDLVLDFWPAPGLPERVQATLFHVTGAARLEVAAAPDAPGGYRLPDSVDPALTVQPLSGSWLVHGKPTFNLLTRRFERYGDRLLEFHGRVGAAAPGVPLWERSRLMNDFNPHLGYSRFNATVRADPHVPYELATPLMPSWPYLSVTPASLTAALFHWGPNRPIVFNTATGQLGQYWAGFHIAGSYQLNSISLPPHTDFESPFAFYRFDPGAGRYANLVVRSDVWPAASPFGPPIRGVPRTAVRMTWTERDPELWRYSLTVLGNHPMTDRVAIGGTRVRAVPYDAFPRWVAEKPWKVVTFVEATHGQRGSEGIYDYTVEDNYPVSFWASGLRPRSPESFTSPRIDARQIGPGRLAPGLRGEYSAVYRRTPRLYLSPVDHRVHLLHAQGGVWNLGDAHILRVANLDGDAYLDAWWREKLPTAEPVRAQGGVLEEALYRVDDYLIYTGPTGVTLQKSAFSPVLETPPIPTDRSSWRTFLAEAAPSRVPRDAWALASWLGAFSGSTLELRGASLSDVRSSPQAFRFVLELKAGALPSGSLDLPLFGRLPPGRHLIVYDRPSQRWSHEPVVPPELEVHLKTFPLATFTPGSLELRVRNFGSTDLAADAALLVGPKVLRRWQEFQVEGGSSWRETIAWVPEHAGTWQATLRVGKQTFPLGSVTVPGAARVAELDAFLLPLEGRFKVFLVLLGAAALGGLGALWASWRVS